MRWRIWEADVTKGSVFNDKTLQTSTRLEEIRFKRNEQAKLLGYKTYADFSMETKMAANVENVYHVLDNLLTTGKIFTNIY